MGRFATLLALSLTAAVSVACAGAQAQVRMPAPVPLAIPAAPPHVVVPAPPEAPPAPAVETPAPQVNSAAVSGGGPPRTRTEPAPARPTPPPTTPPAAPAPAAPTPLEAAPNQGELEQRARALIASAERTLDKIEPKTLGPDGRAQYDTAKRFIKQAGDALNAKNIVYAWQLADKANTIATLLK